MEPRRDVCLDLFTYLRYLNHLRAVPRLNYQSQKQTP